MDLHPPQGALEAGQMLMDMPPPRGTVVNLTPDRGPGTCGGAAWRPF